MITLKKNFLFATLLFSVSLFPVSLIAENEINLLEETIKKIRPFTAAFTQVYFDSFQDKTIKSKGILTFMQPGLMKWDYREPEEMLFIVGAEFAWLYDPLLENVTIQELDKISGIKSMRFLSNDEAISQHFTATSPTQILIEKSDQYKIVFLKPLRGNPSLAELQIAYNPDTSEIHQFVIIDHNYNYRKVTFDSLEYKPSIKPSDFIFNVTEDMEVIQGIAN